MQLRLANAPTSWGIEDPADPANPPWSRVLDGIASAGYAGTELGPLGYFPNGSVLRDELAARGLRLVAGYVVESFHDPGPAGPALEVARRTCEAIAEAGGRYLVLIPAFTPERERAAGRAGAAPGLPDREWGTLIENVHAVARVAAGEYGLLPCFHPHAGTHVEFEPEIERLIAQTDPELLSLCLDTGHSAYAGVDPVELYRRHGERVAYLHLKDVRPERLEGRALGFEEAVAEGVFCPLGEGAVDFAGLKPALEAAGFDGWATVEQDRLPTDGAAPGEQAAQSLRHLLDVGLAA